MSDHSCPVIGGSSFARHIGVDTAGQQSATSFVKSASGHSCPSARHAFIETSNAFCNGSRVYFPWPKAGGQKDKLPPMLRLWEETDRKSLVAVSGSSDDFSQNHLERFLAFVRGDREKKTLRWARFQFTNEITEEYFSRADCELISAAAAEAALILASPDAEPFCSELDSVLLQGDMQLPGEHMACSQGEVFMRSGRFSREAHYVTAYIYSSYLRGWTYNWHLDNPAYRYQPLWLRKVLFCERSSSNRQDVPAWQFPWGKSVANVVEQSGPEWRDWSRVASTLQNIRKATSEPEYGQHIMHFLDQPSVKSASDFVSHVKHIFESATRITLHHPDIALHFTVPSLMVVLTALRAARDLLQDVESPVKKTFSRREIFNLLTGGAFGGAVVFQTTLWLDSMRQHVEDVLANQVGFEYEDGNFDIPVELTAFAERCSRHRSELLVILKAHPEIL